jgi:starch-binding outer membrane protein, SusD/RagB family
MISTRAFRPGGPGFARGASAVALLLNLAMVGCVGKLLDQVAPSRVDAGTLNNPADAQLLVTGAIGDFECALTQYIVATGLVGDELRDAQLAQAGWDYDRRTIVPAGAPYSTGLCGAAQVPSLYTPISIARFQADNALNQLQAWTDAQVPSRASLIAQAATYAGFSRELLGESMCSAAIDVGPELTRAQLFTQAESQFTTAITAAQTANNTTMLNAALIGRARARLNLNKLPEARADAALVPNNFVLNATYSGTVPRRENLVWSQMYRGLFSSVDSSYRNVTWAGLPDPRVNVVDAGVNGFDATTRIFRQTKYPLINSTIPIARSAEAQLIVAEADLAAGNTTSPVTIINQLHANAGIPSYAGGSAAEIKAQIIEERRREFFLEGQRFGDIIRYNLTVVPTAGTPFPKGGNYGPGTGLQICFPLPDVERNNNPSIPKNP